MATNSAPIQSQGEPLGRQILRTVRGVIGLVGIFSGIILFNPAWGSWTRLALPPLIISVLVFLLLVFGGSLVKLRSARTARLVAGLEPLFGPSWNPKEDLKATRFSKGVPQKLKINYPDSIPDRDPMWRSKVEEMARQRMEAEQIISSWDTRKGRVLIEVKKTTSPQDIQENNEQQAEQRIHDILRPMFGTDLKVTVTEWESKSKDNA